MLEDTRLALNQDDGSEHLNIYGKMGRDLIRQLGKMMSVIEKWLREEQWCEITGAGILFSLVVFAFIVGIISGIRYDQSRSDMIFLNDKKFEMVGVALVPGQTDNV